MPAAYKWHRITDLPDDAAGLTDGELVALLRVWKNQKSDLAEAEGLDEFDKRLRREWSIETGIIEDVYTLDRGVTQTLIEKGIDAALIPHDATNRDSTLVARIIQDHYEALDGMFDFIAGRRQLSTSYVKELHAALLRNVDAYMAVDQFGHAFEKRLEKGQYKTTPNSPTRPDGSVHEYCPPEHVDSEMDELLRMHAEHEARGLPPEVEAAWLHHRFAQIHPFADGNGRVARAIASLVFIRSGWFPLIVKRDDRARYIEALEKADGDDLRPLIALFVEAQRNALIQATEIAYEVRPISSPAEAIIAVRDRMTQRRKLPVVEWRAAKETAMELTSFAVQRLEAVAAELTSEIGIFDSRFAFNVQHHVGRTIPPLAKDVFEPYTRGVELFLTTHRSDSLMVLFNGTPGLRLINVWAHLNLEGAKSVPIEGGTFQINYEEDLASTQKRFAPWLDRVIVEGLNAWRRTL
jgi:Fic family protein